MDWECKHCGEINDSSYSKCSCGSEEPERHENVHSITSSPTDLNQESVENTASKQPTVINVSILNESSGLGEKIVRLGPSGHTGTSLLRNATLTINNEKIEINYADDLSSSITAGSILQENMRKIRVKKSAISPKTQLVKPAVSGAIFGIVLAIVTFNQDGSRRGSVDNVLLSITLVLFSVAFFVIKDLFTISRSQLAVVSLDSSDGKSLDVAIEDEKTDSLLALLTKYNPRVEQQLTTNKQTLNDAEYELQHTVNKALKWGVVFSIIWAAGIGSLLSIILAKKAQKVIRLSEGKIKGKGRVRWCFIVGGFGIALWIPIVLMAIINNTRH